MPYKLIQASVSTASLAVAAPVLPGQPITLSWDCLVVKSFGSKVVATISFDSTTIYTSASLPTTPQPTGQGLIGVAGEAQVVIQLTPNQQAAQLGLYMIGSHTLTLSVSGNGSGSAPVTATASLQVIPESLQAQTLPDPFVPVLGSYWNWNGDALDYYFDWNSTFALGGTFINASRFSAMKAQLTLVETDETNNESTNRGSQSFTADIGQAIPVVFGSETQNWSWIACPSGDTTASPSKTFTWSVLISLQDPWGNGYPVLTAAVIGGVSVSSDKIAHQGNAHSAFISGTLLVATGYGAPAGGILLAAAASECKAAQDPPGPDFDYNKTATVTPMPLPQSFAEMTALPDTKAFLGSILDFAAIYEALNQTEGKLIAARSNEDREAVELQVKAYRAFEKKLGATAKILQSSIERTVEELAAEPGLSADSVRAPIRSMQMYGIPASFGSPVREARCCADEPLREFINSVDTTTLPSVADCMVMLTHGLLSNAEYIRANMLEVLAPSDPARS